MGQSKLNKVSNVESAVKDFEKKFKDKTKNNWSDRINFVSYSGKYTLIEVDAEVKVLFFFLKMQGGLTTKHGNLMSQSPDNDLLGNIFKPHRLSPKSDLFFSPHLLGGQC